MSNTVFNDKTGGKPIFIISCAETEGLVLALIAELSSRSDVHFLRLSIETGCDTRAGISVEYSARTCVDNIRRLQSEGPYHILGLGRGMTVAYETCYRLIGQDQLVKFLGLVAPSICRTHLGNENRSARRADGNEAPGGEVENPARQAWGDYCPPPLPLPVTVFYHREIERNDARFGDIPENARLGAEWIDIYRETSPSDLIGRLAIALSSRLENPAGSPTSIGELAYNPVITIQTGRKNAAPIFCIPGAGASVTTFVQLAQALGEAVPIIGLQPRGLCGKLVPHSDVASTAAAYIRAIEKTVRGKPFHLVGHSYGGWIAIEMARQLAAAATPPTSVYVLDSDPPNDPLRFRGTYPRADVMKKLVRLYEMHIGHSLHMSIEKLDQRPLEETLSTLHTALVANGVISSRTQISDIRGIFSVFGSNVNTDFRPLEEYAGLLRVVMASDAENNGPADAGPPRSESDTLELWRNFAPLHEIVAVPGNHVTMLAQPHVNTLANRMYPVFTAEERALAAPAVAR
jgi:thioesterase domain-containing protein